MYVTKKCPACGHWAVFEFAIFCKRATERCTHCRYTAQNIAWDAEARQRFEDDKARLAALSEKHPQLRELKQPGDHLELDE
jgi:hypothetical protein